MNAQQTYMDVRHPQIEVQLSGQDGNAFIIIGLVTRALKRARVPRDEVCSFQNTAMAGDYDHLLQTCMAWVNIS